MIRNRYTPIILTFLFLLPLNSMGQPVEKERPVAFDKILHDPNFSHLITSGIPPRELLEEIDKIFKLKVQNFGPRDYLIVTRGKGLNDMLDKGLLSVLQGEVGFCELDKEESFGGMEEIKETCVGGTTQRTTEMKKRDESLRGFTTAGCRGGAGSGISGSLGNLGRGYDTKISGAANCADTGDSHADQTAGTKDKITGSDWLPKEREVCGVYTNRRGGGDGSTLSGGPWRGSDPRASEEPEGGFGGTGDEEDDEDFDGFISKNPDGSTDIWLKGNDGNLYPIKIDPGYSDESGTWVKGDDGKLHQVDDDGKTTGVVKDTPGGTPEGEAEGAPGTATLPSPDTDTGGAPPKTTPEERKLRRPSFGIGTGQGKGRKPGGPVAFLDPCNGGVFTAGISMGGGRHLCTMINPNPEGDPSFHCRGPTLRGLTDMSLNEKTILTGKGLKSKGSQTESSPGDPDQYDPCKDPMNPRKENCPKTAGGEDAGRKVWFGATKSNLPSGGGLRRRGGVTEISPGDPDKYDPCKDPMNPDKTGCSEPGISGDR